MFFEVLVDDVHDAAGRHGELGVAGQWAREHLPLVSIAVGIRRLDLVLVGRVGQNHGVLARPHRLLGVLPGLRHEVLAEAPLVGQVLLLLERELVLGDVGQLELVGVELRHVVGIGLLCGARGRVQPQRLMPDRAPEFVDRDETGGGQFVAGRQELVDRLRHARDAGLLELGGIIEQGPAVGRPLVHGHHLAVVGGACDRPGLHAGDPRLVVQRKEVLVGQELVHTDAGWDQEDVRPFSRG